ncbi:hypothetical protein [Maridesulfovibrio sp. FT414]|uniref:hypothetical protein n=1 Tax=Maridesulfovibrio sp. FT414 TaxID=2979469 RepID=UPI003D804F60
MIIRFLSAFAMLMLLLCTSLQASVPAGRDNFSMGWEFAVALPQTGIYGKLKGSISHIRNTDFRFKGEYINTESPISSGPVFVDTLLRLEDGGLSLDSLHIKLNRLGISHEALGVNTPDVEITGRGHLNTLSGTAEFKDLVLRVSNLPEIRADLEYSPEKGGTVTASFPDPLPLLETLAGAYLEGFKNWDKAGELGLTLKLAGLKSTPHADLELLFNGLSAASPDDKVLLDGVTGYVNATAPLDFTSIAGNFSVNKGEALYDTFYMDFARHPFKVLFNSDFPANKQSIAAKLNLDWKGIFRMQSQGTADYTDGKFDYTAGAKLRTDNLKSAFKLFAVDPLSLGDISATGQMDIDCSVNGQRNGTRITGTLNLAQGGFSSDILTVAGVESMLPFVLSLDGSMHPRTDPDLTVPSPGRIHLQKIRSGPMTISDLLIPVTVSSNAIEFGTIPEIALEGGTVQLSELSMKNPFSKDFLLHGRLKAESVNLLPLSPPSLPIEGQLGGDLSFWLIKEHLSTSGSLGGNVYGGQMSISEMYAENPFESSRQYGADFEFHNLDLEPISRALDIGRITGRVDLDLNDLVIAYDQPARFELHAETTPGSDSDRDISLKAVNTLSVIGTGSGLTGTSVGVFSQFFKAFGYAGLGLECTLDNDMFRIRGLIRDDGIEYIIKRPPLFGINVINSNPENLIRFSDMLKRVKRVLGN